MANLRIFDDLSLNGLPIPGVLVKRFQLDDIDPAINSSVLSFWFPGLYRSQSVFPSDQVPPVAGCGLRCLLLRVHLQSGWMFLGVCRRKTRVWAIGQAEGVL